MTTQQTHMKLEPLTDEQMAEIEANNKLLKLFSGFIADLEERNPGVELPTEILYTAFITGCIGTAELNQSTSMFIAKQVHELRGVFYTMLHRQSRIKATQQPEEGNNP